MGVVAWTEEDGVMNLTDDLRMTLEQMGGTPEDVAASLRAVGVQGVRNAVRNLNPVVRYVQAAMRLDNLDMDVMTGQTVRLNNSSVVRILEVALPEPVKQFMHAFNRGSYPDLELPHDKT